MGIWNGFDEYDIAIHREEIAAEQREIERAQEAELRALKAEQERELPAFEEEQERRELEQAMRDGDLA